ncbi:MAG: polymer-forming cytoskeletal protein [Bacteroidales bacterium]|nr:polymer-forming cytoskeletal protein [Bacteroidales bacterium]MBR4487472.1 polymer-forming cytoskeletal protein [Bacteroidales bacterium]
MNRPEEMGAMNGTRVNTIAAGTSLVGNIEAASDCRIDGTIKGNINCKSKIIIGQTGVVEGDINCDGIEIEGRVKANINAVDIISLRSTAVLAGDIASSKLAIEPGATFVGNCKIQNGKAAGVQPTHTPAQPQPQQPQQK